MKKLLFTIAAVYLMQLSNTALALQFLGDRCAYSQTELDSPDTVIELRLKNDDRFCKEISAHQTGMYSRIDLPSHGKWPPLHPQKLTYELAKRYGKPKDPDFFEPYGGSYREYKIRDKKPYPPIDGHETLEYSVEILYVMRAWYTLPKVFPYGLVPACERNIVKLYAVKTAQGWFTVLHPGIGSMHRDSDYEKIRASYRNTPEKRKWLGRLERDIVREQSIINQCKDRLE